MDEVISRKTGSLIQGAVEVGALLGRAGAAGGRAISDFGKKLGLAFQVRDDIADSDGGPATPRPVHTALYGLTGSRARLAHLVEEAVASIAPFKERAAELRYLALSLVDAAGEAKNA